MAQHCLQYPFSQMWSILLYRIFPSGTWKLVVMLYFPFAYLLQYKLLLVSRDVNSVIAIPKSCFVHMWLILSWRFGISFSSPLISLFAASLRKTQDFVAGSKILIEESDHSSFGRRSSMVFANFGGVNTSSLLRFAIASSTSGL